MAHRLRGCRGRCRHHRRDQDIAELLAATAVVVGPERACHAACNGVGPASVARALPLLQPLALTAETRRQVAAQEGLLDRLRAQAAATAGGTAPPLEHLPRVRLRTLLLVVLAGLGLYALLPSVGELSAGMRAVQTADWRWLGAALAASALSYVAAAVALSGAAGRALAPLPTVVGQLAASFANRVTPAGLGALALNARLLERSGLTRPAAVGAVALTSAAGVVVHVSLLGTALVWLARSRDGAVVELGGGLPSWAAVALGLAALSAVGGVLLTPIGRRRLLPPLRAGSAAFAGVLRHPRQAGTLLTGAVGVTSSYIAAIAASAAALDLGLSLPEIATAYLAGAALASAVPTPSGLGAAEAALAAALVAVGAALGPAVATVLAFRLVTFWLPILPGVLALRWLRAHGAVCGSPAGRLVPRRA